jgi:hypothetical protein
MNHGPNASTASESLRDALRRAGDTLAREAPPAAVRDAMWKAFAGTPPSAPAKRSPWRLAWAGGGLAGVTLVLAMALLVGAPRDPRIDAPRLAAATPFLPVAGSSERWPQLLREAREQGPAWVVPTELPRESLAAMGLPYDPARAGESVRAELLVHPSGDVLAVRFVR